MEFGGGIDSDWGIDGRKGNCVLDGRIGWNGEGEGSQDLGQVVG